MQDTPLYCEDLFNLNRNQTIKVSVGDTFIGGDAPIQIQSMTTTNSLDTESTVNQVMRIANAGADIVRITTQGRREAYNLAPIKELLKQNGYSTPLVADIHFNPNAAEIAATIVEKVRINPGNFSGGAKKFMDYTDVEYAEELAATKIKLLSFLDICKKHNTTIRIGTNHGSLSDRIMSRFGDTPEGMVEACMEYLRICKEVNFEDIVLSIKASNTRIMVHTVRLLVSHMKAEGMSFPLHLGVTEAGSEAEGRIKSAVGSGALLADGLGDTLRVSLTEDPEKEVPVAKMLVDYVGERYGHPRIEVSNVVGFTPYEYNRRPSIPCGVVGGSQVPVVLAEYNKDIHQSALKPDFVVCSSAEEIDQLSIPAIIKYNNWESCKGKNIFPLISGEEFLLLPNIPKNSFVEVIYSQLTGEFIDKLKSCCNIVILINSHHINRVAEQRAVIFKLNENEIKHPLILRNLYSESNLESFQIKSATDSGIMFLDGFCDGLFLQNSHSISGPEIVETSFGILQAARSRFTKTEFISCPGCGRTLFDLQSTTKEIKARTSHLKGLKIGIMGCIVNGVGEMADADYGYIGSGPGKVSLFKNRDLVLKNIEGGKSAVEALIKLIKNNGDWVEP